MIEIIIMCDYLLRKPDRVPVNRVIRLGQYVALLELYTVYKHYD